MTTRLASLFDALGYADAADPFSRAVARGVRAPDLGEAFYEGYQSALLALVSTEVAERRAALCVTERGGGHPRAVLCALRRDGESVVLTGEKTFVTGADRAALLFVVAREDGDEGARPSLRVVRVPVDTEGLTLHALPPAPFAPGVHHARVVLDSVRLPATSTLPGDGYATYVKPFRTVEDVHVVGALLAHLAGVLDTVGDEVRVERLLALVASLATLARRPPLDRSTHRALAGALELVRVALDGITEAIATHPDATVREGIARDLALLGVAEGARRKRLDAARAEAS